jgi:hypothetical protein
MKRMKDKHLRTKRNEQNGLDHLKYKRSTHTLSNTMKKKQEKIPCRSY